MLTPLDYLIAALAALAAGGINALAGGGTLITFPILTFLGVPAVSANVTNTVALCPGYFGGTLAQVKDLKGQTQRLWLLVPASIVGGVLGGFLLLRTGEKLFTELVPYLILLACVLLAVQDPVRAWLMKRMAEGQGSKLEQMSWLPVGL
ncbi:MAG TPA: sulfite exporter TauE/SafE family protein, partial [Anaerolineales bacterium]|nr:sulfite exporter TauE/SafE family protein [Anaerolineales bacterium]